MQILILLEYIYFYFFYVIDQAQSKWYTKGMT